MIPVTVGRERSIAAAQYALRYQQQVEILMQRDSVISDPIAIDFYRMGNDRQYRPERANARREHQGSC